MSTDFFNTLYRQTQRREHVRLRKAWQLWHEMLLHDWPACGRLADLLIAQHQEFDDDLRDLALQHRIRIRQPPVCPDCGDPDCIGAVLAGAQASVGGLTIILGFFKGPPHETPPG